MRRFPLPILLLGLLLAACGRDGGVLPPLSLESATIEGDTLLLAGENFLQYPGGARVTVEACGVAVEAEIVDPATAIVPLAPGQRVRVEIGTLLEADLAELIAGTGSGDVRVVTADGREATLPDVFVCEQDEDAGANRAPIAEATASALVGEAPFAVDFDASASSDPDDDELTFEWAFGDEGTDIGGQVSRTFTEPGIYPVTLTVSDPAGLESRAELEIRVAGPAPVASVALSTTFLIPGEPAPDEESWILEWVVDFAADANTNAPIAYEWTWPDGSTDTERHVSHSFTESSPVLQANQEEERVVTLRVTDVLGRSDVIDIHLVLDPIDQFVPEWADVGDMPDPSEWPEAVRLSYYEQAGGMVVELETTDTLTIGSCEPEDEWYSPQGNEADVSVDFGLENEEDWDWLTLSAHFAADGGESIYVDGDCVAEEPDESTIRFVQDGAVLRWVLPSEALTGWQAYFDRALVTTAELRVYEVFGTDRIPDQLYY